MKIAHYRDTDNLSEILRAYRLPTLIISIGLVVAILGFLMALKYDMGKSERVFRDFSEQIYRTLDTEIRRHEQLASSIARMLGQIKILTEGEFTDIANAFTENNYFIHISLYELMPDGSLKETYPSQSHAHNIDNASGSPEIKLAIENSKLIGKTYFARPYEIQDATGTIRVAAIAAPIEKKYKKNLYLVSVINLNDLYKNAFEDDKGDINIRIYTLFNLERKLVYEQFEAGQQEFFKTVTQDQYQTLHYKKIRFFDDFQWEIHMYSSLRGFAAYMGVFPWITFFLALFITTLVGYLAFRITGENVKTRMLVDKQTKSLREYTEKLEISNRDLDDFAYIASHDLKEPLRGIYNYSEFLLEDYRGKIDDEGQYKLQTLKKLSRRMESLIDMLLEYSRISREDFAHKKTDINMVVKETLETIHIWLEENKAQVTVQGPLPSIVCDHARVSEVFRNLITNAVKYNNKPVKLVEIGSMTIEIEGKDAVVFYVRDNGIGIPDEHQKIIFKIFKRLHGRDEYGGGTGSGLTIVKKIIDRHGGKIWVESIPNVGTTFFFTLKGHDNGQ